MIEHTVKQNANAPSMTILNQFFYIRESAKAGIDGKVVDRIIFVVGVCSKQRIQVNAIDSQLRQVIEIFPHPPQGSPQLCFAPALFT